ncbi:uncharacterized protein LOC144648001 [Oculina patagonica]
MDTDTENKGYYMFVDPAMQYIPILHSLSTERTCEEKKKISSALTWGHILIVVACVLTCEGVITNGGVLGCKPCAIDDCKNETNCLLGSIIDICNCCTKCLRVNGQTCGGIGYVVGRCAKGLKCSLAGATYRNPVGHCISLVKPTTAPVQKLFINKTLFDEVNLDQQSNYARHNIPGLPVSKMVETVNLPGNDTKYYVHSSSLEITNSANTLNGSGMVNTTRDQAPQKKSNKAAAIDDSISDIGPAVIFVAVSGAVFLCLIGLLFLPVSPKTKRAQISQTRSQ